MDDPDRAAGRLFADTVNGTMEHMQGPRFHPYNQNSSSSISDIKVKSKVRTESLAWVCWV